MKRCPLKMVTNLPLECALRVLPKNGVLLSWDYSPQSGRHGCCTATDAPSLQCTDKKEKVLQSERVQTAAIIFWAYVQAEAVVWLCYSLLPQWSKLLQHIADQQLPHSAEIRNTGSLPPLCNSSLWCCTWRQDDSTSLVMTLWIRPISTFDFRTLIICWSSKMLYFPVCVDKKIAFELLPFTLYYELKGLVS